MAILDVAVFSASIDNEDAIREWIEAVGERAKAADLALSALSETLRNNPHVSITLHRTNPTQEAP